MDWIKSDEARADDLGREDELAVQLRSLDPSQGDPSYWVRFRNWVMTDAASELARRRLACLLYTSPSPRDQRGSRMPSSA